MPWSPRTLPQNLTGPEWLRVLSDFRQHHWPPWHPRERRKQKRDRLRAFANLMFNSSPDSEKPTVYSNCPVLDVSAEGLAIRSIRKIPASTALSLELIVGDKRFMLAGKVTHNSGFPGAVQVGIALEFPNPPAGEETPVA